MTEGCRLGRSGVDAGFVAHLGSLLARDELVKVRFADVEGAARKALAAEVCGAVGAECVGIVGRTMLVYRARRDVAEGGHSDASMA